MTTYRLTLEYDTAPGGQGTPLPWGEPEDEVLHALDDAGIACHGVDAGTAFMPGAPRDVTLYVEALARADVMAVLVKFPHGLSWDVEEVDDDEEGEGW